MEEKIIIQSDNKKSLILLIIAVCALVIAIITGLTAYPKYKTANNQIVQYHNARESNYDLYMSGNEFGVNPFDWDDENDDYSDYIYKQIKEAKSVLMITYICAGIFVVCCFMWLYMGKSKIVVTNKRIYGNSKFGKYVDIPLSSIIMVQIGNPKKITLATSAGKVSFVGLKNINQVYGEVQMLIANNAHLK